MSWEHDPRSGALLHKPDRRSEHVVPAWAVAGLAEMLRFGHTAEELRPYGLLPPIAGGYDAHPNFAYSTVATAPSPANSGGSLVVAGGEGGQFASTPFNCVVCPAGTPPRQSNAEIVRVTNRATDTLTITRTQESTSARTILVGDQIFAAPTAKTYTDLEGVPARSYRNAAWTTITAASSFGLDTVTAGDDPAGAFSGANYTVPSTGWYEVTGNIGCISTGAGQWFYAQVSKTSGGVLSVQEYGSIGIAQATGNSIWSKIATMFRATAGDTIQGGYNCSNNSLSGLTGIAFAYLAVRKVAV